jgi:protein TonB
MAAYADIFERSEPLAKPFWGSLAMHLLVIGSLLAGALTHGSSLQMGSKTGGGGMGGVMVNPVASIPLPNPGGLENPVANDTESQVPSPPPTKAKPAPKLKVPPPNAIALKGSKAPARPSDASAQSNKYRDKQKFDESQIYTPGGQRVNSSLYGIRGSGSLGLGDNSPFGLQFGSYATRIYENVSANWRTSDIDQRIQTAEPVVVTFRILRDGSIVNARLVQPSGIEPLNLSALRAVMDTKLGPLPAGFPRDHADVELTFKLRR